MADNGCSHLDTTMDKVVKNIYTSCDVNNKNLVPVSELFEYIKPYMMEFSLDDLDELRSGLDPDNVNPSVSRQAFYYIMAEWTDKMKNKKPNINDDSFCVMFEKSFQNDTELSFTQSTPRPSVSCNYREVLDLSSVATDSTDHTTEWRNKADLEEEIKKLIHENHRLKSELDLVQPELTLLEQQNDQLQAELNRVNKHFAQERQLCENLQKNKIENAEILDELAAVKEKNAELKKRSSDLEKSEQNLFNKIMALEAENAECKNKLIYLKKEKSDLNTKLNTAKADYREKEVELLRLVSVKEDLKSKLEEQLIINSHTLNENELLNEKREVLQKIIQTKFAQNMNHSSPVTALLNLSENSELPKYNSPKLKIQLECPISPIMSTPLKEKQLSEINNDEVKLSLTDNLRKHVLIKHAVSTPVSVSEKYLLNSSLSKEMENFKTLTPSQSVSTENDTVVIPHTAIDSANSSLDLSNDEDIYFNQHAIDNALQSPRESLQSELRKVLHYCTGNNCEYRERLERSEQKILYLEQQAIDHDKCAAKIDLLKEVAKYKDVNIQNDAWHNVRVLESKLEQLNIELKERTELHKNRENELQSKLSSVQTDFEALTFDKAQVALQLDEVTKHYQSEIVLVKETLKTEISSKIEQLNILLLEKDKYNAKLKELKSNLDKKEFENFNLQNEVALIRREVEQLVSEGEERTVQFEEQLKKSHEDNVLKCDQLNELSLKNEVLHTKYEELLTTTTDAKALMENELESIKCENDGLVIEAEEFYQRYEKSQQQLCASNSLIVELQTNIKVLSEELSVKNDNIKSLEAYIIQIYYQIETALNNFNIQYLPMNPDDDAAGTVNSVMKCLHSFIHKTQTDIILIEQLKAEIKANCVRNEGLCGHCGTKNKRGGGSFEKQNIKLNKLEERLDDTLKQLETERDLNKTQTETAEELQIEIDSLKQQLAHYLNEGERNYVEIKELKSKLQHSESNLKPSHKIDISGRPLRLLTSQPPSPDSPCCELDLIEESSYQSNDSICEEASFLSAASLTDSEHNVSIVDQIAFPSQSDDFLLNLGLDTGSPKKDFSNEDAKQKFTALALAFAVDSSTAEDRYVKQRKRYLQLVNKNIEYMHSAIVYLQNPNKDREFVSTTTLVVVPWLASIKDGLMEIFAAAEQCGKLQCELRYMKCWNLVTNYVAILSRDEQRLKAANIKINEETVTDDIIIVDTSRNDNDKPSTIIDEDLLEEDLVISSAKEIVSTENVSDISTRLFLLLMCVVVILFLLSYYFCEECFIKVSINGIPPL